MRILPTIFAFLLSSLLFSQKMNLTDFAHSKTGDDILKAVSIIKRDYSAKKKRVVLEIPPGIYTLTQPLVLDKYISLEGDASGGTVLQVKVQNMEGIILENNRSETDINSGYNTIRNLTITGPDFGKNPFEWKDTSKNNIRSIGIKIQGLRNRIENCTIDGFSMERHFGVRKLLQLHQR